MASDTDLKTKLNELNDTVNDLEEKGPSTELMVAYVDRAFILFRIGYSTSALEDLLSASEMFDSFIPSHNTLMKYAAIKGLIDYIQDGDGREDFDLMVKQLDNADLSKYDLHQMIETTVDVVDILLVADYLDIAYQVGLKAVDYLEKYKNPWTVNNRVELLYLLGAISQLNDDNRQAIRYFTEGIEIASDSKNSNRYINPEELARAYVSRSDLEYQVRSYEVCEFDLRNAIAIMEELDDDDLVTNFDILINAHEKLGRLLISLNRDEEGEKHLMDATSLSVYGADGR